MFKELLASLELLLTLPKKEKKISRYIAKDIIYDLGITSY